MDDEGPRTYFLSVQFAMPDMVDMRICFDCMVSLKSVCIYGLSFGEPGLVRFEPYRKPNAT